MHGQLLCTRDLTYSVSFNSSNEIRQFLQLSFTDEETEPQESDKKASGLGLMITGQMYRAFWKALVP